MSDPDREKIVVEETPPRVERETTVVTSGDGGGSGTVVAVVLLLVVAVGLFLFFGGYLDRSGDDVGVNVNVDVPEVKAPDIDINLPPPEEPAKSGNST